MASIVDDGNGLKRLLFTYPAGKRKAVRLGKMSKAEADPFKNHVEQIISDRLRGRAIKAETSEWLASIGGVLHSRIAKTGLIEDRAGETTGATLAAFIDSYTAGRTDIKPNTLIGLGQARRNLVAFFGEKKRLEDINAGDAEEYWRYLIGKLSINTARRLAGRAKQFFRFAVRKRIIRDNPFEELESNVRSNPERKFFITRDVADKVSEACPDAQWRLIFALSRYGGLRCPSEHLSLKWADVDFERNKVRVPSPKTEHIEGRASRMIPLFPELRKPLLDVFGEAPDGSEYVITRYRDKKSNLRTHFERIISRAGLTPWPKLFHNLRATRQTELSETYPVHVVCGWLGNTEDVAKAHYLQITEAHFAKAAEDTGGAQAAQKAAHIGTIQAGTAGNLTKAINGKSPVLPGNSAAFPSVLGESMASIRVEPIHLLGNGF